MEMGEAEFDESSTAAPPNTLLRSAGTVVVLVAK